MNKASASWWITHDEDLSNVGKTFQSFFDPYELESTIVMTIKSPSGRILEVTNKYNGNHKSIKRFMEREKSVVDWVTKRISA